MAKKTALFGGRTVKVENRSGFDKSFLNMFTTGVGTITPVVRKLLIPSSGRCKIPTHVELPPLAANAYLRSHWKMEAFFCPLRLCYGGFQSWFSGEPVYDIDNGQYSRAKLPYGVIPSTLVSADGTAPSLTIDSSELKRCFGAQSLSDYFNLRFQSVNDRPQIPIDDGTSAQIDLYNVNGVRVNLFPYLAYHLIIDHYYRNKSVSKPAFTPPLADHSSSPGTSTEHIASYLPFESHPRRISVILGSNMDLSDGTTIADNLSAAFADQTSTDFLNNGRELCMLVQRNYGDDYFTAARPNAQDGNPVVVQTDQNGRFTIAALRVQNSFQEFSENQNYATPDFIQTNKARYGVSLSEGIAQKPILLGSADFPIYTKSVELNTNVSNSDGAGNTRNPFALNGILGSKAGSVSGNGVFSFDFDVKEPGYLMVFATLVPEANYAFGLSKEMRIFTEDGSLVDLPCSLLEHVGDEPVFQEELVPTRLKNVFGYVQRYLWHKAGSDGNQIHGLFRSGESLQAFAPQRYFGGAQQISSSFLAIRKSDLDDVAAVNSGISDFGVMADCAVELFISEPLSESALPALVNPASEHGRSVYLKNGGSKF